MNGHPVPKLRDRRIGQTHAVLRQAQNDMLFDRLRVTTHHSSLITHHSSLVTKTPDRDGSEK
jgi:hypothetical protein